MIEHTKNQHFVPQFLLRNFASKDNKFIWSYDKVAFQKGWKYINERSIKSSASEKFLYDVVENTKEGSYEYKLAKVENVVAPIINKLIVHRDLNKLLENERNSLAHFLAIQLNTKTLTFAKSKPTATDAGITKQSM